jgi:O-antigen ligase
VTHGAAAILRAPAGDASKAQRREAALWAVVLLALTAAFGATAVGLHPLPVLTLFVAPLVLVAGQRVLLAWGTLLGAILVVILFVPIRRYTVGGGLPIELEPYRVLIAVVLLCWLLALAADRSVRWRATGLEAPIIVFGMGILISLALNIGRVNEVSDVVIKQVSFFASFFLTTYFVASVIKTQSQLDRILRLVVLGGAVLAAAALFEWRSGENLFNGLGRILPFLQYQDIGDAMLRGNGARALASAQHPIALGAVLVMLLPLTVYLYRRDGRVYWLVCSALLTLGALASGSRTAALMLITLGVAFLWLKRAEALRLAPLMLPLILVIQVVMPGTLGTFRGILQPSHIISEQSAEMGTGSGRIADLGPSLAEFSQAPFVGQGFGTRVVSRDGEPGGAQILDDQWLGLLLEVGAIGTLGLLWLFARAVRRLARRARSDTSPESWLATTLAAALMAYAVGMFTFDAFAFIQVTFFCFVMLGFTAVVLRRDDVA